MLPVVVALGVAGAASACILGVLLLSHRPNLALLWRRAGAEDVHAMELKPFLALQTSVKRFPIEYQVTIRAMRRGWRIEELPTREGQRCVLLPEIEKVIQVFRAEGGYHKPLPFSAATETALMIRS